MLARSCCWRASACCLCVSIHVTWVLHSRVPIKRHNKAINVSQDWIGIFLCTCNQQQPAGADGAAAAVKAQADEDAALLAWCTPPCSRPLASSSLDPSPRWSSGGATASSRVSARSVPDSTRVNRCCCSCSLPLQRSKWQNSNQGRTPNCCAVLN